MASKLFLCNPSLFSQTHKLFNYPNHFSHKILNPIQTSPSRSLTTTNTSFTWDEALSISQSNNSPEDDDSSYLQPFFQRIKTCNRGMEKKSEFFPFIVEDQIVGYIHEKFADDLKQFKDVFTFGETAQGDVGVNITLHPSLGSPGDRTEAVGYVIKCLGEGLIPAVPCEIIIWEAIMFLSRACSRSLFWDKVWLAEISVKKEAPILIDPKDGRSTVQEDNNDWFEGKHACIDLTRFSTMVCLEYGIF